MKKRGMAFLLALVLSVTGVFVGNTDVRAEEPEGEDVDITYLLTEDARIGYLEIQTYGIYLVDGYSVINDAGGGKIGCGGTTHAATRCKVSVNAIVERKTDTGWARVTSWTQTNTNALYATVGKYLAVASGNWYRVRCVHSAASDTGNSFTGALWM